MSLTDIMSASGLTSWTEVALILCFLTFTAIVVWVFAIRSKPSWEHQRNLPLEDDGSCEGHATAKGGDLQ
ncbi:MAG: cbb3-type cytochrome c oxidase subunit 3 [Acidobacteria bacterium]|nr:cbb3-type cytochrome c oxidase subunit 3 [Acidobacteriota bacterium]